MENLEGLLKKYSDGSVGAEEVLKYVADAVPKKGIGSLGHLQRKDMLNHFNQLHAAIQILLMRFNSFDDLAAEREKFDKVYELLKVIAISALNLLDLEEPSLQPLSLQKSFEINQEGHRFTVF